MNLVRLKHLFFRVFANRFFKYAVFALIAWWAYQQAWVAKPEFQKKTNVTQLSDAEAEYYAKSFDYVMDALKAGESYTWETYSSKGTITARDQVISKSGATCRAFTERYTIGTKSGEAEGFGCKRDNGDGWCKLKFTDARTCVLEPPRTFLGRVFRDTNETANNARLLMKGTIDFW